MIGNIRIDITENGTIEIRPGNPDINKRNDLSRSRETEPIDMEGMLEMLTVKNKMLMEQKREMMEKIEVLRAEILKLKEMRGINDHKENPNIPITNMECDSQDDERIHKDMWSIHSQSKELTKHPIPTNIMQIYDMLKTKNEKQQFAELMARYGLSIGEYNFECDHTEMKNENTR